LVHLAVSGFRSGARAKPVSVAVTEGVPMSVSANSTKDVLRRWHAALNGKHHRAAVTVFMLIVLAHWAEHVVQAWQIWGLDRPRPMSRGVLGAFFPVLVSKEWLHYGYALVMLIGLWVLRDGFVGRAKRFWTLALIIQFWHHIEHLLLFIQGLAGVSFFGAAVPTSVLQLFFPRVELHLFYNAVVFVPMVIAVVLHFRPSPAERAAMDCSCVPRVRAIPVAA
jgi:hypothetical protein